MKGQPFFFFFLLLSFFFFSIASLIVYESPVSALSILCPLTPMGMIWRLATLSWIAYQGVIAFSGITLAVWSAVSGIMLRTMAHYRAWEDRKHTERSVWIWLGVYSMWGSNAFECNACMGIRHSFARLAAGLINHGRLWLPARALAYAVNNPFTSALARCCYASTCGGEKRIYRCACGTP